MPATSGVFLSHGEDFVHYNSIGGGKLFAVNSSGLQYIQGGVTLVAQGNPGIVAVVNASLGYAAFNTAAAVNLLPTTAPTGTYRISLYGVTTTTFTGATEEVITFGWSDDNGAQTLALTTAAETAGTTLVGSQLIRSVTGTAVTYTPSKTGSSATAGTMALSIVVEQLI